MTGRWVFDDSDGETRPFEQWKFVEDEPEPEVTILPVDPPKKGKKK